MTQMIWPRDYVGEVARRIEIESTIGKSADMIEGARLAYKSSPKMFVSDCVWLCEPRNANLGLPVRVPAVLFPRQGEFLDWMKERFETRTSAPVEKSRDSGATWMAAAFAVWLWTFHPGAAVGFGSRKEVLVDQAGDMGSIFEKIRSIIRHMPAYLKPPGLKEKLHFNHMRIINPDLGTSIVGEAGDNIGRGGRTSCYFIDEAAYIERPQMIEASLTANTDCRIDISSPRVGTLFNEWCAKEAKRFVFDVSDAPWHTEEWKAKKEAELDAKGLGHIFRQEYLRDGTAGIEGQLIKGEWVEAALNAAAKLGVRVSGERSAALDVADGGQDRNAIGLRHGIEVQEVRSRAGLEAGDAGTWAYGEAFRFGAARLRYDSIGVGAGAGTALKAAKADREKAAGARKARAVSLVEYLNVRARRRGALYHSATLVEEGRNLRIALTHRYTGAMVFLTHRAAPDMQIEGWAGSNAVVSPTAMYLGNRANEDMFKNAKSQAWWALRDRFIKTFKAVKHGAPYDPAEIISLSPDITEIRELKTELCQVTYAHDPSGKIVINKAPDGHMSPNRADCVVIVFAPRTGGARIIGSY